MHADVLSTPLFMMWWSILNGITYFISVGFLIRMSSISVFRTNHMGLLSAGLGCIFTVVSIYFNIPNMIRLLLGFLLLCLFALWVLKLTFVKLLSPVVIIFTLQTFMEAFFSVTMRGLIVLVPTPMLGYLTQILLSFLLVGLFGAWLHIIETHYSELLLKHGKNNLSSYLYILLLPCFFMILAVRLILTLDSANPGQILLYGNHSIPIAYLCLVCALILFFIIIHAFSKILRLAQLETQRSLLDSQLGQQEIYLTEAEKRMEKYRSFQHDVHNHFLILSGLLGEHRYEDASDYAHKLRDTSADLLSPVSSGNAVLDILLNEKISFAKQNNIQTTWDISLPTPLSLEIMDVCVIVSNALDNAIFACIRLSDSQPELFITATARHQFLLIELRNTADTSLRYKLGTGLKNIEQITLKYNGAMEIESEHGCFRLSVLLPFTK